MLQVALVGAQLALIAVIALNAGWSALSAVPVGLAAGGALLGLWTLAHNRPGNFNIRPAVREGARLIVSGPYRHLRHPMYASLLLVMGGMAANAWPRPAAAIALAALVVVLAAKMAMEERALARRFPDYPPYAARTARLIPGLL